jgi:hypothetical protein
MTEQGTRALHAASNLREALERTAAALASPRLEALLAGEAAIASALSAIPALEQLADDERLAVQRELERARGALMRCRRLGTSLREFIRISFEAQGRGDEYGPRQSAANVYAGQALNARV